MSTVKAINFQHPSASAANITLASDGTVSGGIPSPNRNLLYNGAMQVSQRGTSTASITAASYNTADRWYVEMTSLGTWTQSVENDAPTGSGFRKSLRMLCTTADASPAAGDNLIVQHKLEGQDLQRIAKGTSSAQQLTLSFWVKANTTGTYIAELYDVDNTRQVSASYTISASATWERKTITFPADTTGAFDNDNALSLVVGFWLGGGTNFTSGTLNTVWAATTDSKRAVGQTNLAAATNNYWQVTGVQLEVGSQATAFEFKSFGQELRECLRYFEKSFAVSTTPADGVSEYGNAARVQTWGTGQVFIVHNFLVEKRATPTIALYNPRSGGTAGRLTNAATDDTAATTSANVLQKGLMVQSGGTGLTANNWYCHFTASAEL